MEKEWIRPIHETSACMSAFANSDPGSVNADMQSLVSWIGLIHSFSIAKRPQGHGDYRFVPDSASVMFSKIAGNTGQMFRRQASKGGGSILDGMLNGKGQGLLLAASVITGFKMLSYRSSSSTSSSSSGVNGEGVNIDEASVGVGVGLAGGDSKRKKSILYTRTGDKGESSLYNGERRSKTDPVFLALGEQDELCAAIGIAREYCVQSQNNLSPMLIEVQSRLFDLGSAVATPINNSTADKLVYTSFPAKHTEQLEVWIDSLDAQLPPLTTFIIPSGGLSSTHLHLARVICRRAERAVVPLIQEGQVDIEVGRYLNRLSDLLFASARTAAFREKKEEIEWRKAKD